MKFWIKTISYGESTGKLREIYNRVKGANNYLDNVLKIHSLRPHTLEGHMKLYKNVLHHLNNKIPKWFLETLGIYVSMLNRCDYCIQHHFAGLKRLLNDNKRAKQIWDALQKEELLTTFDQKELSMLVYAKQLTLTPQNFSERYINNMKNIEISDGEILEANQVISYFNYVNRTVSGLGVTTEGDILGLSPSDDSNSDNWTHQ